MKATELMLNNAIIRNGILVRVDEQTFWDIQNFPEQYRPIPLTEEWLVSFGYEYDTVMYWKIVKALNEELLSIGLSKCSIGWSFQLVTFGNQITNVEYVHQLQNLYFALTGEELIAKK